MIDEIKNNINKFNSDLNALFGCRLLDIIVYGSAARGGFCTQTSDIDIIVFVNGVISQEDIKSIVQLHEEYRKSTGLEKLLEGKYIGITDNKISNGYYIGTSRKGWKEINDLESDYIEQAMILDCYHSVCNSGLVQKIMVSDFNKVNKEILIQIENFLTTDILGKNAAFTEYACITAARSLYTFFHKDFLSKKNARTWLEKNYFNIDYENPVDYIKKIKSLMLQSMI